MHPLALLAPDHNARIAEDLHVVGQGGLADVHLLQQTAGALLFAAQKLQNADPVLVAEGLEQQSGSSFVHGTPPIDVYQYYNRKNHVCQYS